jgi:hypothetical protein
MTTTADPATLQAAKDFIYNQLDIQRAVQRAQQKNGWNDDGAMIADKCYRDFLWVCCNYDTPNPNSGIAAISTRADEVWHFHLVDMLSKYLADCANIFGVGYYLDHRATLADGQAVNAAVLGHAQDVYRSLGVAVPADLEPQCVYAVIQHK